MLAVVYKIPVDRREAHFLTHLATQRPMKRLVRAALAAGCRVFAGIFARHGKQKASVVLDICDDCGIADLAHAAAFLAILDG